MKKILIVEDVALNVDLLVQLLEDDYELVTATDGATGINRAIELLPDLILMDLSIPGIDGWEATQRLKAHPATAHIPVVVLTAHAMKGDEQLARAKGADDYITKPIDETLLFKTIERFLQRNG
jgi:two-component system, cell cycle response regulator DivK